MKLLYILESARVYRPFLQRAKFLDKTKETPQEIGYGEEYKAAQYPKERQHRT